MSSISALQNRPITYIFAINISFLKVFKKFWKVNEYEKTKNIGRLGRIKSKEQDKKEKKKNKRAGKKNEKRKKWQTESVIFFD